MALPEVVSREEWLEARVQLLAREKEQTRAQEALNAERRRLPMVRIAKTYVFSGPEGPVSLDELFGDRSQLIIQHVMFDPSWDAACPGCHTYSVYARGTEYLASAYGLLDLTAFGRSEDWEEPKGRARVLHGADPTFTD